jgi:hypothetical protein
MLRQSQEHWPDYKGDEQCYHEPLPKQIHHLVSLFYLTDSGGWVNILQEILPCSQIFPALGYNFIKLTNY